MIHGFLHILLSGALLLMLLGAALGYGALVLRWLSLPQMTLQEGVLFGLALGLGMISLLVLLMGALHLIFPVIAGGVLATGLLLAVVLRHVWRLPHARSPEFASTYRLQARIVWLGLVLVIGLALGYTLLAHALMPPVDYDVVAYHFAIPELYIEAHSLIYLPYILHSNWPLGTEMLFLLGLLFHSEVVAQLITWSFAILLCAALILFGERWFPFQTGWIAAAVLCSVPMFLLLAGTGMIEVPLACYTFLAFYALWHGYESQEGNWLVLSALLAGCAAATKLNGAAAAIIFAILAMGLLLRSGHPIQAVRAFVMYGVVSFLVVLPWYVKAWYFTGNPIWPFLHPVLGGSNWDALGSTYLMDFLYVTNMPLTFDNWLTGLWQVTVADGRFGSFPLGFYVVTLLPLGLLAAVFRSDLRPLLTTLSLAIVAFYTVWFFLTHQTRFLMSMLPFAVLFGAAGVAWLWERGPRFLRAALQLGLLVWLLAGAWIFNPYHRDVWQRSQPYLSGQITREEYLTSVAPGYSAFQYANRHLPPDARVLLAPYDVRGYYLERSYLWANPIGQRYLRLEQMEDATELRAELQRQNVTHVLMNTHIMIEDIADGEQIHALLNELTGAHGRLIFESQHARLYVLDYAVGES